MSAVPLLSCAIWLPIAAGLLVLAAGLAGNAPLARKFALFGAAAGLFVAAPLYFGFDVTTPAMQFVESKPWIPLFRINYHLGVDGLSAAFVMLNCFITLIVVFGSRVSSQKYAPSCDAVFLVMSGLFNGIFSALDGMLFYVFFEASLIPLYLLIGIWGGPGRVRAAFKFFLFTLMGSLPLLVAMIYLFFYSGGNFSIAAWHLMPIDKVSQTWVFFAFFMAFAVKTPMWPLHTWLPEAHVEAPTGGSIVLAAIALKLGAYGFLRLALPVVPDASREFAWIMVALSLAAVVYIGLVALAQMDMKKLVAYSSVAHMGFVTLGIFMLEAPGGASAASSALGIEGALIQMISHGFVAGAMFFCIGVLYERTHSRQIADYGGITRAMPKFAVFFMLFSMANIGLPGTSGFVGEILVILSAAEYNYGVAFVAASTLILSAAYTLWMYKRVMFGPVTNPAVAALNDIDVREFLVLSLLALGVLGIGLYPRSLSEIMRLSVSELLRHIAISKVF
ncbi:MAG: NADH-quinone oxidoreductase subunit M [Candidatus Accumulibacter sp.]|nr:NADH-quinone oxidoreductase subunit M [Accumulibacter sp.]